MSLAVVASLLGFCPATTAIEKILPASNFLVIKMRALQALLVFVLLAKYGIQPTLADKPLKGVHFRAIPMEVSRTKFSQRKVLKFSN